MSLITAFKQWGKAMWESLPIIFENSWMLSDITKLEWDNRKMISVQGEPQSYHPQKHCNKLLNKGLYISPEKKTR